MCIRDRHRQDQGEGPGGPGERLHQGEDPRQALRSLPDRRERVVVAADAGSRPAYRRIVLKLSGEALSGGQGYGVDPVVLLRIGSEVREVAKLGVQIAIVIGGGTVSY